MVDKEMKDLRNIVVGGSQTTKPKKVTVNPTSQVKSTRNNSIHHEAQDEILRRLKNL